MVWKEERERGGGIAEIEVQHHHSEQEEVVQIFGGMSVLHQEEGDTIPMPHHCQ